MEEFIDADGALDLDAALESRYADAHALPVQPEWIDELADAHTSIETAFVRVRGTVPYPQVELEVRNSRHDETGWHRLEYADGWRYAYEHPPAGVVAALAFLESSVDGAVFEQWWREHV